MSQAPAEMVVESRAERMDVGYEELRRGDPEAAIKRIGEGGPRALSDPLALINLGTASARLGRMEEALRYYRASIQSDERFDVQLSDGRWMDSRTAARIAIRYQSGEKLFAGR